MTQNPIRRELRLRTVADKNFNMHRVYPVCRAMVSQVEAKAHSLLANRCVRGEWFDVALGDAELAVRRAIQMITAEHSDDEKYASDDGMRERVSAYLSDKLRPATPPNRSKT